ncbi:MAG: hypothetical protein IKU56_01595 [Clostridia bacterium]|nr:hypothetical protein [Clostridia bacterium]
MKIIPRILAHTAIILALVLITLLVFDYLNPSMEFINNTMSKVAIGILCVIGFINAGFVLTAIRRR